MRGRLLMDYLSKISVDGQALLKNYNNCALDRRKRPVLWENSHREISFEFEHLGKCEFIFKTAYRDQCLGGRGCFYDKNRTQNFS
jgi:hypothetical protein